MDLRERITLKACKLFTENGIRAITMDDIAKAVGISKRTLYENFSDKESLLLESVKQILTCRQEKEQCTCFKANNCIELFLNVHSFVVSELSIMNRNFMRELKRSYPPIYALFEEDGEEKIQGQIKLLEEGKSLGLIREDINSEISSLLIKVQFEMLWHSDAFKMNNYTFSEVLSNMILNFVRGIATPKGITMVDEYVDKNKTK